MADDLVSLTPSTEPGRLGVLHLKRYWHKKQLLKQGRSLENALPEEWNIDTTLLAVLGLGLHQTLSFLLDKSPTFEAFEDWVLEVNHHTLPQARIADFNALPQNRQHNYQPPAPAQLALGEADLEFWDQNGYVIVRNAVPKEDCELAIQAICEFLGIDRDDPATWYGSHPAQMGIFVQLLQHPAVNKNRRSPRIRAAYEQLWNRGDLWMNTDTVGFNPPETDCHKFRGADLHWDVSLAQPIPFGTQGILYLSDTAANQGAFTLVPGFHRRIAGWLEQLPAGAAPRRENLHALGSTPVAAAAGDFIIWHHALPHGASPNLAALPRYVQYLNYQPLDAETRAEWI